MWKALVKWVESWSYRCDHDWDKGQHVDIYERGLELPIKSFKVYTCKKCKEYKRINL